MKAMKCGLVALLLAAGGLGLTGCGSNPNEGEYKAPPGKPPDDPEDKNVAHRRERTRNVSKQVQKIEARGREAAEKAKSP